LRLLDQEQASGTPNAEVVRSLARVLLLKLEDTTTGPADRTSDANYALYLRFQEMLSKHYNHLHGTEGYAGALGVSPRQLNQATRSAAGKSPCDFASDRVMAEAKRLLVHSAASVKEVSFALGFADPNYFSRVFKKHTRQSPEQYRRQEA